MERRLPLWQRLAHRFIRFRPYSHLALPFGDGLLQPWMLLHCRRRDPSRRIKRQEGADEVLCTI